MKRGSIFETDGIPRIQEALPLALQHVVAMIVGCVTPAIIVAGAAGLENKDQVIARIHEAEKYIPLDRLYLRPQCGFASCEIGNKLTEEEQWAKLKLVKEVAEEVWGKDA